MYIEIGKSYQPIGAQSRLNPLPVYTLIYFYFNYSPRSMDELRLGTGPIPAEQTVMQLNRAWDVAHNVRFVSFCTGYGNSGVWKLTENQGR